MTDKLNLELADKMIASKRHQLPPHMQTQAVAEIKHLRAVNAKLVAACNLVAQSGMRNEAYDACLEAIEMAEGDKS